MGLPKPWVAVQRSQKKWGHYWGHRLKNGDNILPTSTQQNMATIQIKQRLTSWGQLVIDGFFALRIKRSQVRILPGRPMKTKTSVNGSLFLLWFYLELLGIIKANTHTQHATGRDRVEEVSLDNLLVFFLVDDANKCIGGDNGRGGTRG